MRHTAQAQGTPPRLPTACIHPNSSLVCGLTMRCLSLLLVLAFSVGLSAATPFPHEKSDLQPDPAARFGTLPNGMRYVIRPNHEPKQRASLRLVIHAGSLHEKENQRGLAHFLEHLAFNGSEHYSPGTLIEFFQRMGMNFGDDTNASTSFDRTIYMLELPDTKEATLAEGFQVFADYAGGLLLQESEIDKERGVILSEKRTRDSVGYRTLVAQMSFMLQGSRFPERFPIGETEVIQQADREQFLDFYNTWYRPDLMDLVVVGDIDPMAVERMIVSRFSALKARAPEREEPPLGQVALARKQGIEVFYHFESEAPETSVSINTIQPHQYEPDTAANRVKYLPRTLANAIINRRISELAKKEDAPFIAGGISAGEAYDFYRETSIGLRCRADQWQAALAVADQELRRALEHGFQVPELREVQASFRNSLEQAVRTAPTRRSEALAAEIAETLVEREVFTTPSDDRDLYVPALERVTVEDCLAALRDAWSGSHRVITLTGNARIDGDAVQAIRTVYENSRQQPVEAPAAITEAKWGYTHFGAPGKVAKREHVDDLDVTLVTFENGVRLNLKRTDFEANRIRISLRVGNGQLTEPRDKPGLAAYTGQTFVAGGLGQHSADELRRILAGRTVGAGVSVSGDAFVANGTTNREDLELQFELLAAYLTDPGFRPEAARQARKALQELYLSLKHTASGPFTLEVSRLLASGDPRFGLPPEEEMLQRNLDEVKAWVLPELAKGYVEIAVVGDQDLDQTIAAVARTFGALPRRNERQEHPDLRDVKFPSEPLEKSYEIDTEIPKGVVAIYWPTTDSLQIQRSRRLSLLGLVLSDRLRVKVREELGDAYSPGAGNQPSDIYPGYGYMVANVTIDPPRAELIAGEVIGVGNELAAKGATEDEVARAKQPLLTQLRESARTNGYWLINVLARAQERPQHLEWARTRYSDIESITVDEINSLAKAYLAAERASRVIVVPDAKTTPSAQNPQPTTQPAPGP